MLDTYILVSIDLLDCVLTCMRHMHCGSAIQLSLTLRAGRTRTVFSRQDLYLVLIGVVFLAAQDDDGDDDAESDDGDDNSHDDYVPRFIIDFTAIELSKFVGCCTIGLSSVGRIGTIVFCLILVLYALIVNGKKAKRIDLCRR